MLAKVARTAAYPTRGERKVTRLEVTVTDGTGTPDAHLLRQALPALAGRQARPAGSACSAGTVDEFRRQRQLVHPDYLLLDDVVDVEDAQAYANQLIPIYPAAAKLETWKIPGASRMVLDTLGDLPDPLPDAVAVAPRPAPLHRGAAAGAPAAGARRSRTRAEAAALGRGVRAAGGHGPAAGRSGRAAGDAAGARPDGLLADFDAAAAVRPHEGQQEVGAEISTDLARAHPMHRLLQGEVGSGKTVVALRAMLAVVDSGGQAALLAPTEVLAQQHHRSITEMLGPLAERGLLGGADHGTRVALLTGSQSTAARRQMLADIDNGRRRHRRRHPCAASRTRSSSTTSAWWSSTSSTGSASSSETRCGQGEDAAAPAGHDGDADPAHGRDDRLRRSRRLDADRAARGTPAHHVARRPDGRQAAFPRAGLAAHPRGGRGGASGVRRDAAHR